MQVPVQAANRARRYAGWLGLLWGGDRLLAQLAEFESYSAPSQVVLHFPLIVLSGYVLYRIGQVLRQGAVSSDQESRADATLKSRAVDLIGRALIGVVVGGPLVAAVGYFTAAQSIVYPTVLSLGLLALLVVLGGLLRDFYAAITGRDEKTAREALIPMLLTIVLGLMSLPAFALIWGARMADLTEIWARFGEGVQLGDARVSPTDFLTFAIIFVVGYALTRLLQSTLRNSILPKT